MNNWEKQKTRNIFANDIKNFIYNCLENLKIEYYSYDDLFQSGYESAMEEIMLYIDTYEIKEEKNE
jgi:hypothetical protein